MAREDGGGRRGFSAVAASGVGITRRFGRCRGAKLDDVRDDEPDVTDSECPGTGTRIADRVCDGGS